jgi:hypothetical protein
MKSFITLGFLASNLFQFANCFLPDAHHLAGRGFEGPTIGHAQQTKDAIHRYLKDHFKIELGFRDKYIPGPVKTARDTIVKGNKDVDAPDGIYTWGRRNGHAIREKDAGPAHFDDELFLEGQERLMILRSQMITKLREGNVYEARIWLGRQLHALQDFYSHSNWVEIDIDRQDQAQ